MENNKRITVVALAPYSFLPAKIGGQKGIALFYKYFCQYAKLIVISVKNNDATLANGYMLLKLLSNHKTRYINPILFFRVKRVLKENKATHLLIEHPYYGWLAVLLKWFTGIKFIVHSHNNEALRFKAFKKWWWPILWWYERFTHRWADYNFFIREEDQEYAIKNYGLLPEKCLPVTYGIEQKQAPSKEDINAARQKVRQRHGIQEGEKILLFTGSFNYAPNIEALNIIQGKINPLLLSMGNIPYKILICGPWMPGNIKPEKNVIFAGFVDDINEYFKAADVFINPVIEGGGIKTKLVEALGNNTNVVSTKSGALGVREDLCNRKLFLAEDHNWEDFTEKIFTASNLRYDIGPEYFHNFYWGSITRNAVNLLQQDA